MQHTYSITGITCQSCVEKVQKALEELDHIESVEIDLKHKIVKITMQQHVGLNKLNKTLEPLKKYKLRPVEQAPVEEKLPKKSFKAYWPLILVFLYIIAATAFLSWQQGDWSLNSWIPHFMGLFFLSFAFFKLLDLKGFAASYLSYDLPTKAWPTWGYIYPFMELALGALYLFRLWPLWTNMATIL